MKNPIVSVNNLSKSYSLYKKKSDRLLEMFSFKKGEQFLALSDISFDVFKGETIGIIGINGSGKSTLSSILAQIIPPTTGQLEIVGEVSLVAISAGLNNQLTGLENIELKCLMHGLTKEEINEVTPLIIEFADIGEFIHQPIKSYSSGMRSRLGFSISIFVNPDILVIDEALSVGDSTFYQKCLNVFADYQKQGKTIFFISHSLSQVKTISDKILWINFGKVEMFDSTDKVAKEYESFINDFNEMSKEEQKKYRSKMLTSQMKVSKQAIEEKSQDTISRREKSHQIRIIRKKRMSFFAQLTTIFMLFLGSVLFLFTNNEQEAKSIETNIIEAQIPENGSQDDISSIKDEEITVINETALIIDPHTPIYKDAGLEKEVHTIPFGTEVKLLTEEKQSDMYGFEFDGDPVYVQKEKVKFIKDIDAEYNPLQFSQIIHLFPQSFIDSYMFLLSFADGDKEQVQNSLQGITSEYIDEQFGLSVLEYGYVNTSYLFDEGNQVKKIIVNDINAYSDVEIEDIAEKSFISTEDKNRIGVLVENYIIIFDRNNSIAIIKENSIL